MSNLSTSLTDSQASDLFKDLLRKDAKKRNVALDILKSDPASALAAIQRGDSAMQLSSKGSADVLDDVLGTFADPAEARVMMNDHLTPERQVELIKARGDLPAVVSEVADLSVIVDAIREEVAAAGGKYEPDDEDEEDGHTRVMDNGYAPYLVIRAWAMKLKDRSDYAQLLDEEVGSHPIRRWLIVAIWYECGTPSDDDEASLLSEFDNAGLDPQTAQEEFLQMQEARVIPHLSEDDIQASRIGLAARHKEVEDAPTITDGVREAQAEAAQAAEDADI